MKHKLKYFGIGLFVAGFIFSLSEKFDIPYIESSKNIDTYSEVTQYENEITSLTKTIAKLEDEVQLLKNENEDLLKSSANTTTNDEETDSTATISNVNNGVNTNAETSSSSDSSKSTSNVATGTIYIYESVSLYDIGQQVEDLKIIENGRELELYLAKPEYARSIQKGVFELSSNMTLEEMAKILTGKK